MNVSQITRARYARGAIRYSYINSISIKLNIACNKLEDFLRVMPIEAYPPG